MNDTKPTARVARIGGASGFWGDSMVGAPQLVNSVLIDYLVFDYLAETTMAILAATLAKKPELGYATDFVDTVTKQVLPQVMQRGITVIANAGGINPHGCARALKALADTMGLAPRIAVVEGDEARAPSCALPDHFARAGGPYRGLRCKMKPPGMNSLMIQAGGKDTLSRPTRVSAVTGVCQKSGSVTVPTTIRRNRGGEEVPLHVERREPREREELAQDHISGD